MACTLKRSFSGNHLQEFKKQTQQNRSAWVIMVTVGLGWHPTRQMDLLSGCLWARRTAHLGVNSGGAKTGARQSIHKRYMWCFSFILFYWFYFIPMINKGGKNGARREQQTLPQGKVFIFLCQSSPATGTFLNTVVINQISQQRSWIQITPKNLRGGSEKLQRGLVSCWHLYHEADSWISCSFSLLCSTVMELFVLDAPIFDTSRLSVSSPAAGSLQNATVPGMLLWRGLLVRRWDWVLSCSCRMF